MTRWETRMLQIVMAAGVGALAMLWSGTVPGHGPSSLTSAAEARIGRPLTPLSYAGVARRTTRRAVYGAAAVGAAAGAYAYGAYGAGCAQVVNAYGQLTTVCR